MPETTLRSSSPLQDVWRALVRHKGKTAACFLAITASAALLVFLLPKTYQSEGKLLVRLGRENATLDPTVTLSQEAVVAVPLSRESEINSVVEILQSRSLLEKVADEIGPAALLHAPQQSDEAAGPAGWLTRSGRAVAAALGALRRLPERWLDGQTLDDHQRAVALLTKNVHVAAARKSNVVQVLFEGRSPEMAQAVVARLLALYLDEHARLNRPRGAYQFFSQQAARLHEELMKKEAALCDLKTSTSLPAPEQQRQALAGRVARLQDELLQAEAAETVSRTKVEQVKRRLAGLPETQIIAHTEGVGNEGTDRIREQLYMLQLKSEDAHSRYTDAHPRMQQLQEQLSQARKIVDSQPPTRTHVTGGPSRLYEEAQAALLVEEPLLASWQSRAGVLGNQLAQVRGQLRAFNEDQLRIAQLERDVELCQANYRKYSVNLEQARIDQALEAERMSNLSVVQPASYEPRAVRPQRAMSMALGMVLGLLGGVGLALAADSRDRRLRSPEDLETKLSLPALGAVPRLRGKQLVLHATVRK
jgi:uncharacterized protein involved in exopolysaccharide biosynthesis